MNKTFEIGKVYFYDGAKTLYSQINPEFEIGDQYKRFNFMFLSKKEGTPTRESFYKILILDHQKVGWIYCRSDEVLWRYIEPCQ